MNHLSTTTDLANSLVADETYFDQKTGAPLLGLMVSASNDSAQDYSITLALQTSNVLAANPLTAPPLLTNDVLQRGPMTLLATPVLTRTQAIELATVGTGVIAFSALAAVLVPKAIETISAKAPEAPLPKALKDFLKKYAGKKFEDLFNSASRKRKSALITPKEVAVLISGVLIIALINAFVSVEGYPGILDFGAFGSAFMFALISAFIVQAVSFSADIVTSLGSWTQKELKFWNIGSLTYFVSGVFAMVPFSSPSISKTLGATSNKLKQEKKIRALNAVTKALIILSLTIPFSLMATTNALAKVGTTGLLTTVVMFCCALMPIPPLGGRDILSFKKKTSFALAIASVALLVLAYLGVISYWSFLIMGVAAVVALPIMLRKVSAEKAKIKQIYVSLWFH
jgi:hypothetical protein